MPPVRIEGEREQEILDAAVEVLAEVGYDRLTMDAVAAAAKASKATLYRRFQSKAHLVLEALCAQQTPAEPADTGTLRGDLLATLCVPGGLGDAKPLSILSSVITAVTRDPEFADAFRRDFIAPKQAMMRQIFERAQERGEVRADADLDILSPAIPAIVMHRLILLGEPPSPDLIARVIDEVIVPATTQTRNPT